MARRAGSRQLRSFLKMSVCKSMLTGKKYAHQHNRAIAPPFPASPLRNTVIVTIVAPILGIVLFIICSPENYDLLNFFILKKFFIKNNTNPSYKVRLILIWWSGDVCVCTPFALFTASFVSSIVSFSMSLPPRRLKNTTVSSSETNTWLTR